MPLLLDQRKAQDAKRLQDNQRLVEGAAVADDVDRLRRLRSIQEQQGKLMAAAIARERAEADAELARIRHEVEVARADRASYEAGLDARDRELNQTASYLESSKASLASRELDVISTEASATDHLHSAQEARSRAIADQEASTAKLAQARAKEAEAERYLQESIYQNTVLSKASEDHERYRKASISELNNTEMKLKAREASISAQEIEIGKQRARLASDRQVFTNARKLFKQH